MQAMAVEHRDAVGAAEQRSGAEAGLPTLTLTLTPTLTRTPTPTPTPTLTLTR